jgi:hypothetical protein
MAGEAEVLEKKKNLPQCRIVHHKTPNMLPGREPGDRRSGKPATNHLTLSIYPSIYYSTWKDDVETFKSYWLHKNMLG